MHRACRRLAGCFVVASISWCDQSRGGGGLLVLLCGLTVVGMSAAAEERLGNHRHPQQRRVAVSVPIEPLM